jgi:hypothetical protein
MRIVTLSVASAAKKQERAAAMEGLISVAYADPDPELFRVRFGLKQIWVRS